ncbi:recombination regulator RecX [Lampropedia aestuarii]|uniref:Regulatory protein RecX n=1 Tax=Lampropedia aestuarii TaxID=2562762 RepID=A0A4S5BVP0_9BURK|nr:recombination regulator RecX [Lampropedia aestuarii]THJ35241.1 recombination regulator RecX [Lampropedia aestuarii]
MQRDERRWGSAAPAQLTTQQPGTAPPDAKAARTRQAPSLSQRALQALSRREYSRMELQRKLAAHADSEQQLQEVLDTMQAKGFLSDVRAAEAMTRQKSARFGNARIRQELMAKGIEKDLISDTLAALEDSEWERAKQVWQSKFGHLRGQELAWPQRHKLQAKQLRFMLGRGFSSDLVRKLMQDSSNE